MSALAVPVPAALTPRWPIQMGRAFVHPLFDALVIGGGLSLLFTALLLGDTQTPVLGVLSPWLALLVLVANNAHFAASTVRLYSKPNAMRELRLLTMALPLATLAVLTAAVAYADRVGASLLGLYLTWSPFHYSAQAYGLSLIYSYRSGCAPSAGEKRWLRLSCLAPFLALLVGARGVGLDLVMPQAWFEARGLAGVRSVVGSAVGWLTVAVPIAVFARMLWQRRPALPLISLMIIVSNGAWLITLNRLSAFAYATVFHGLQYLAIVTIFHVKDRVSAPGNVHGWAYHTIAFYAACLALGYLLFQVWPFTYVLLGFGLAESALLVTAIINLHHFIVDAYIWKLRQRGNYKLATDAV
jgi:hypothetical protein